MRCSTGLEMSKTASTSAIALLAMAKITRSWSVKSMVSPPMLVTAAKAAVVRFSDSAGVLVPKCDGRSSEPAATWAFLPGYSNRLKERPQFQFPGQYVGTHQGGSLFPFRHTLLRELVVEACMSYV